MQKFTAKPGIPRWVVMLLANLLLLVLHLPWMKINPYPWFTVLGFNVLIFIIIQQRRITAISFSETSLLVEITYWGRHKTEEYPYTDINFSYDKELVARGKVEETLIIRKQKDEQRIAFLSPFSSGFTKEEILAIVATLEEKRVQRIA